MEYQILGMDDILAVEIRLGQADEASGEGVVQGPGLADRREPRQARRERGLPLLHDGQEDEGGAPRPPRMGSGPHAAADLDVRPMGGRSEA